MSDEIVWRESTEQEIYFERLRFQIRQIENESLGNIKLLDQAIVNQCCSITNGLTALQRLLEMKKGS